MGASAGAQDAAAPARFRAARRHAGGTQYLIYLSLITQTYGNTALGWRRLALSYTYVWPHQRPASWFS